jgi:hypothetical protein
MLEVSFSIKNTLIYLSIFKGILQINFEDISRVYLNSNFDKFNYNHDLLTSNSLKILQISHNKNKIFI